MMLSRRAAQAFQRRGKTSNRSVASRIIGTSTTHLQKRPTPGHSRNWEQSRSYIFAFPHITRQHRCSKPEARWSRLKPKAVTLSLLPNALHSQEIYSRQQNHENETL